MSVSSFFLSVRSFTRIQVPLELHFPASLEAGYGHVTRFPPIGWEQKYHLAASGNPLKGQLVYDLYPLFFSHFIMKIFKYTEKLEELYSEHSHIHPVGSI